jgi:hypothetical protein
MYPDIASQIAFEHTDRSGDCNRIGSGSGHTPLKVLTSMEMSVVIATTLVIFLFGLIPLFKPRSRLIVDTIWITSKEVILAGSVLATIGSFYQKYPLHRMTLVIVFDILLVSLPLWIVWIRDSPRMQHGWSMVVSDDEDTIAKVIAAVVSPVIGSISERVGRIGWRITATTYRRRR